MRGRLIALLVTIPLVASSTAGVLVHVCHSMGGVTVAECDCEKKPHGDDHAAHGHHATNDAPLKLKPQPCCEVQLAWTDQVVAVQEASALQIDEAKVGLVDITKDRVLASREACDPSSYGERDPPSIHGPPIFKRNCSFLN